MINKRAIALRNLKRSLFRTLAVALGVSLVAFSAFAISLFTKSVKAGLERGAGRLGAEMIIVPKGFEKKFSSLASGEPLAYYMDMSNIGLALKEPGVKSVTSQVFVRASQDSSLPGAWIAGYDPETDFVVRPWLSMGRMPAKDSFEAVTGADIPCKPDYSFYLYGRVFKAVGCLESSGTGFMDGTVYIPFAAFYEMATGSLASTGIDLNAADDKVSAMYVQSEPYDKKKGSLYVRLQRGLENVKVIPTEEAFVALRKQITSLVGSITVAGAVVWAVAVLMIGLVFSMSVNERQREIGLLRAMGASKSDIFGIIIYEAGAVSLAGGATGALAGGLSLLALKSAVKKLTGMPFLWPDSIYIALSFLVCIGLSVATGMISAMYPALRSSLMEPSQAIQKGQ